ncbi:MAG TPA: hypothetical protein VF272_02420 [Candidatus Saccharimonadia bacterium]
MRIATDPKERMMQLEATVNKIGENLREMKLITDAYRFTPSAESASLEHKRQRRVTLEVHGGQRRQLRFELKRLVWNLAALKAPVPASSDADHRKTVPCPFCAGSIKRHAVNCMHRQPNAYEDLAAGLLAAKAGSPLPEDASINCQRGFAIGLELGDMVD